MLHVARWARMGCYPCDSDSDPAQPVADGPVGPYVTRGPGGLVWDAIPV